MEPKVKVSSLLGNAQKLDGGAMFGNAPRAVWEKWCPADQLGRIDLACRSMLIETDNKKILFETGIGASFEPKLANRYGVQEPTRHLLIEELNEKGIDEKDIDYVVLSHLHFDHAGGLLPSFNERQKGNKNLHFPNAKYILGKTAWERAINPHPRDRASFLPELIDLLNASGRLKILAEPIWEEKEGFISLYLSEGHTPGQLLSIVKGKTRKIVFCGDLIPGSHWMHLPITMGYDRFPETLIDEKSALYDQLEEKNDILFFTHDYNFAAATFERNEKGRIVPHKTWETMEQIEF